MTPLPPAPRARAERRVAAAVRAQAAVTGVGGSCWDGGGGGRGPPPPLLPGGRGTVAARPPLGPGRADAPLMFRFLSHSLGGTRFVCVSRPTSREPVLVYGPRMAAWRGRGWDGSSCVGWDGMGEGKGNKQKRVGRAGACFSIGVCVCERSRLELHTHKKLTLGPPRAAQKGYDAPRPTRATRAAAVARVAVGGGRGGVRRIGQGAKTRNWACEVRGEERSVSPYAFSSCSTHTSPASATTL